MNVTYSIGLSVAKDGEATAVIWDSPAFKAGLDVGTVIQAVNGTAYSGDVLKAAIVAAQTSKEPIKLLVKSGRVIAKSPSTITAVPAIRASRRLAPAKPDSTSF